MTNEPLALYQRGYFRVLTLPRWPKPCLASVKALGQIWLLAPLSAPAGVERGGGDRGGLRKSAQLPKLIFNKDQKCRVTPAANPTYGDFWPLALVWIAQAAIDLIVFTKSAEYRRPTLAKATSCAHFGRLTKNCATCVSTCCTTRLAAATPPCGVSLVASASALNSFQANTLRVFSSSR